MNSDLCNTAPFSSEDTTYQGEDTEKIGFLNQKYFDLIEAKPTLGDYFSLGSKVIAVLEGRAYGVAAIGEA